MQKQLGLLGMVFAVATVVAAGEAPNVILTDAPTPVAPGDTFQTEIQIVVEPGTPLGVYQLALGYDPDVLEHVLSEDLFGDEAFLTCNVVFQDPSNLGGFAAALFCEDYQIFSPAVEAGPDPIAILRVTFRVNSATDATATSYTVLQDPFRTNGTIFESPLVADFPNYNIVMDADSARVRPGMVAIGQPTLPIVVDIKPDNHPNSINPFNRGVIPVAILGSELFDVIDIDVMTLRFGPSGASIAHNLHDSFIYNNHLQDVNMDGFMDLVTHYRTWYTGISCGDESATLTGETSSGEAFEGSDSVRTVGCLSRRGIGRQRWRSAEEPE